MKRIGLICAGGKSTRTREIGVMQKACAMVKWNGKIKPVVVHQIDALRGKVDEIYVVVGWMAEDVKQAIRRYNVNNIKFFHDRKIEGLGAVWKQFTERTHYRGLIISVNVDDLHQPDVYDTINGVGIGMVKATRPYGELSDFFDMKGKTVYEVENGYVKRVIGKCDGILDGYIGSGIYVFNADDLRTAFYRKNEKGEYDPDLVVEDLISKGVKFKCYETGLWCDVGNPKILKKVMVGNGEGF